MTGVARINDTLIGAVAAAVAAAVVDAPAHAAASTAAAALAAHLRANSAVVWQVDYVMRELHTVGNWPADHIGDPAAVTGSPIGDVFTHQRTTLLPAGASERLLVPLTCRGHRIGVLEMTGAPGHWPPLTDTALRCAQLLAPLLWEAGRDNDVQEQRRRSARLSLPAEMQWQLLPTRGLTTPQFSVYAQLEPAQLITSDLYDWSYDGTHLTLAVLDATGEGIMASQASELALTALRNARRAQLDFDNCVSLADQALHDQYSGQLEVAALIVEHNTHTHTTTYIRAGTPQLLLHHHGQLTAADPPPDPPLGAAELTPYRQHHIDLPPGGLALLVTDGVLTAPNPHGEPFGITRIEQILNTPGLPDWDIPRAITHAIRQHVGQLLPDDASILTLRPQTS